MKMNMIKNDMSMTYQLEEALSKGTLFKSLYMPYKYENNISFNYPNKEERILGIIRQITFGIVELNLYLDVNPFDKAAIDLLKTLCNEKHRMLDFYKENYGSLEGCQEYKNEFCYATKSFPWEMKK